MTQKKSRYASFARIDGRHPFKKAVPEGYVDYPVRARQGARLFYFNFNLARDMGLLPRSHPDQLNNALCQAVTETFALQIINEYDVTHGMAVDGEEVRPYSYMATRYLQLQHPGNKGTTSGDGRSIWNGVYTGRNRLWDVSSCGTGATRLSPATAREQRFFRTGDPNVSYGCGRADLWDGYCAALMSDILFYQGLATERTLAILSYPDGSSINVRAAPNLLRPAHFFMYIKQGDHRCLQQMADYYIQRQIDNGDWPPMRTRHQRYRYLLDQVACDFARTAARFESDYIFCWLDWDGDNILMDGGIIDYGSLRQFGLYHHEYRYDDVDRLSTTITEQKNKARYIVQTFAQGVEFLITGRKRNIKQFRHHPALSLFDETFQHCREERMLFRLGLPPAAIEKLTRNRRAKQTLHAFMRCFAYFERAKSQRGPYNVSDGIMWDAIFCMRDILRELPTRFKQAPQLLDAETFIAIIRSNYARPDDVMLTAYRRRRSAEFQRLYWQIMATAARLAGQPLARLMATVNKRSAQINRYERITGDAMIHVARSLINAEQKLGRQQFHRLSQEFIRSQLLNPDHGWPGPVLTSGSAEQRRILDDLMQTVSQCREGI